MKYIFFVAFFTVINLGGAENSQAQSISWYYPWQNTIQKLEVSDREDVIPLPLNGTALRIVKIANNTSKTINLSGYISESPDVSIELYYLPEIRNFNNKPILDLMIPFKNRMVSVNKGSVVYFLAKYVGIKKGQHNITIAFKQTNGTLVSTSQNIFVGNAMSGSQLNLNVWAYFYYPLIKGLQSQVVQDLEAHHANVLVIPSNVLPSITANKIDVDAPKLDAFIKGLTGKFDYYLVYRNYKDFDTNFALSTKWKRNFPQWQKLIKESLVNAGIDYSKVYFYPFDEPNAEQAQKMIGMITWAKEQHIKMKYFVTIGAPESISLARYADIVQIYNKTKNFTAYNSISGKKAELWYYDIISEARNRSALSFLKSGWIAYKYNASGIGAWNYADIGKAYSVQEMQSLQQNANNHGAVNSWSIRPKNYQRDYSLIYREGNQLYSSLRWEALSQSLQEFQLLKLYQIKYGTPKANTLVSKLISGKASIKEWDAIKVSLIN